MYSVFVKNKIPIINDNIEPCVAHAGVLSKCCGNKDMYRINKLNRIINDFLNLFFNINVVEIVEIKL